MHLSFIFSELEAHKSQTSSVFFFQFCCCGSSKYSTESLNVKTYAEIIGLFIAFLLLMLPTNMFKDQRGINVFVMLETKHIHSSHRRQGHKGGQVLHANQYMMNDKNFPSDHFVNNFLALTIYFYTCQKTFIRMTDVMPDEGLLTSVLQRQACFLLQGLAIKTKGREWSSVRELFSILVLLRGGKF